MPPTFVLIPGAWHRKESITPLRQSLEAAGYAVQTGQLRSVGAHCTNAEDVQHIRENIILPLIDNGTDIIVVLHSMAGIPGGVAVKGLGKQDRGGKAGIVGIVYLAAFIPHAGVSSFQLSGNQMLDWWALDDDGRLTVTDPTTYFYADVEEPLRTKSIELLTWQSLNATKDPIGETGYNDGAFDGRRFFVHTLDDAAIPYEGQKGMLAASGVEWETVALKSGHSPFLSRTDETTAELVKCAEKWKS